MAAMEGNAAQLLHSCKGRLTYDNLLQKLRQRYGSSEQVDRYRQEIRNRRQKPNESLSELATDIEKLVTFGYPDETPEAREKLFSLPAFMNALADNNLGFEVFKIKPTTLREALNMRRLELKPGGKPRKRNVTRLNRKSEMCVSKMTVVMHPALWSANHTDTGCHVRSLRLWPRTDPLTRV